MLGSTRRSSIFLLVMVFLAAAARGAGLPPLAERVPEDAYVYVSWAGADALAAMPQYQQSHLKALLDASNMREVANDLLPRVMARIAQENGAGAAHAVDVVRLIGGTLWRYPSAAYFTMDLGGGPPMPRAAVFSRVGKDAPLVQKRLDELLAQANPPPEVPVRTFVVDEIVGVSVGYDDGAMALAGGGRGKPLSDSAAFTAALGKVANNSEPAWAIYYDNDRLMALADKGVQMANDPRAQEYWPRVKSALGLEGFHRVVALGGFDGKGWSNRVFVDVPAPRRGIFAILEPTPLSDEELKMIPADATSALAGGIDIARVIEGLRNILGEIDPNVQAQFGQVLGLAQMYTGVNLENDLFKSLGPHWVAYQDPQIGGMESMGMIGVNKLTDPAKAQRALSGVALAISNTLGGFLRQQRMEIALREVKSGEVTANYFAIPFFSPSWVIKDGYLYVALYPQNAIAAAKRGRPERSILDNKAFQELRAKLGDVKPGSLQFNDLARAAQLNYQTLLFLARTGLGFADLFGVRAPELVIPPLEELTRQLEPAGSIGWADDQGFHARTYSPFPGSALLEGPSLSGAVAAPAFMASVLLPSLNRARETANRIKCASNQRMIGQAILLYANDNKGQYPPDLGTLVITQDISADALICPSGNGRLPPNWNTMNDDQKTTWANGRSDYLYVGNGMNNTDPAEMLVLHEKESNHNRDGVNMLFGDGHVEFVNMPQARKLIAEGKK